MSEDIDRLVAEQPEKVHREVTVGREAERPRMVQSISQAYPTTVEDLWDACTSAERLPRWFAAVSGDLRLGGRYQVEGNAGGTVVACEPPQSFTLSWESGEDVSEVVVRISAEGERARLTLTHTGDVEPGFWATYGPGATGVGWDLALLGLALHLATGADRPEDPDAFARTEPARRFIRDVSSRWGAASSAAGTPEPEAATAAASTAAFYLGESAG